MITQEIAPHKQPEFIPYWKRQQQQSVVPAPSHVPPRDWPNTGDGAHTSPYKMDKVEYARYLQTLKVKKGDLVASKWCLKPYHARAVYMVISIQEIHSWVDYWGPKIDVGPSCLLLQPFDANAKIHHGGGEMYIKVEPDDIPNEWKVKMLNLVVSP